MSDSFDMYDYVDPDVETEWVIEVRFGGKHSYAEEISINHVRGKKADVKAVAAEIAEHRWVTYYPVQFEKLEDLREANPYLFGEDE